MRQYSREVLGPRETRARLRQLMRITEQAGRGGRKVRNKGDNNKRTTNTMCGMAVNADDGEASGKGGGTM